MWYLNLVEILRYTSLDNEFNKSKRDCEEQLRIYNEHRTEYQQSISALMEQVSMEHKLVSVNCYLDLM